MDHKAMLAEVRRAGLTQARVAEFLGMAQGSVSKLERGEVRDLSSSAFLKLQALHERVLAGEFRGEKSDIVAKPVSASPSNA